MELKQHSNLYTLYPNLKKVRTLPRFPYCYLTFAFEWKEDSGGKGSNGRAKKEVKCSPVMAVNDISLMGMQLKLASPIDGPKVGASISGLLSWKQDKCSIKGKIEWVAKEYVGISFAKTKTMQKSLQKFLSPANAAKHLLPLHQMNLEMEKPAELSHWLYADGPVEVFVWKYPDGEMKCFQIIFFDDFIEWQDGIGMSSGRVVNVRGEETPLYHREEFHFDMDSSFKQSRRVQAYDLINCLQEEMLGEQVKRFLLTKLDS